MATDYPGAIDGSSKLPNPATTDKRNNPSHAGLHDNTNDAIKATQTKVGTGASVAAANTLFFGTGAGTSAWTQLTSAQLAAALSDETGTGSAVFANTPVLITPKIDTITENTSGNGTTINGVLIKSSLINGSFITGGTIGNTQVATGAVVQMVNVESGAVATGTTLTPADDTIPQSTEGDQYMSLAITPKATTNILVIQVVVFGSSSVSNDIACTLFQDSTANALAVTTQGSFAAGARVTNTLTHKLVAGTTSSTTFKVRVGQQSAGTYTFNGFSAGRFYGGAAASSMLIWEIKV